jgi:hypothetical protein
MGICTRCKEMKNLHLSGTCNLCRKQVKSIAFDSLRGERDSLVELLGKILKKTSQGAKHTGWELEHAQASILIQDIKLRQKFEHKVTSQRPFQEALGRVVDAKINQQTTVYRHPGRPL